MIRAVVDTNTIVSAVISPKGPPRQVFDAWRENRFTLVTSPSIMAEVVKVLHYDKIVKTYQLGDEDIRAVIALLWTQAEVTYDGLIVSGVAPHHEDDKFVACAIEGKARFIVTGDKAFQACGQFDRIRIISPRTFIEFLGSRPD